MTIVRCWNLPAFHAKNRSSDDFSGEDMVYNPRRIRERRLDAARGYLLLEMPQPALAELAQIQDPGPQKFEFHLLKGECFRALKRHEEALSEFEEAHHLHPSDLDVLMGMAWCFKRTSQLLRAIDTMHSAYASHAEEPVVLYNLSCYYALVGQREQALSWLGRALRMNRELLKLVPDETDFDPIREDAEFRLLIHLAASSKSAAK